MKYLMLLALLAPLCACVQESEAPEAFISDDFRPYVDDFRRYYIGIWPPYLIVRFGDPVGPYADCTPSDTKLIVLIRPSAWVAMQTEQRRATIFHELGHCILGIIGHSDNELSYMYIDLRTEQFYIDNKQTLINELF